jgi:uncharacterized protein with beta-barrel porin domain
MKAGFSLAWLQKGANTIDNGYDDRSAGATDWFVLHDPVVRNIIVGLSAETSLTRNLGIWGRMELWLGDTPKENLGAGLLLRYSTR